MKCKKCKKECMESELVDGFCYDCLEKYKIDINGVDNSSSTKDIEIENEYSSKINTINSIYRIVGSIIVILVAILYGIALEGFIVPIIYGLVALATIYITSLLLEGLSTITQLLEDIKNK